MNLFPHKPFSSVLNTLLLSVAVGSIACSSNTDNGSASGSGGSSATGYGSGGDVNSSGGSGLAGGSAAAGGGNTGDTGAATGGQPAATGGTNSGGAATGGTTGVTSGCDATTTPVARHGKLSVKGNRIVNQCGRAVTLRGMSLYDWNQQGSKFYNADAIKNLAQQKKCTVIRVPLIAANYPGSMDQVKTVMDACIANGIYCIPNWHVVGASDVTNATAFYVDLAQTYGNTPNIIYEPWNEPTTQTWATIKAYHEQVISAVRPLDPDNIFLLGNRQWDQRPDEACNDPVTSTSNVAYVVHFYANTLKLSTIQANIDSCLNKGFAIFISEYGGVSSNGNGTFNTAEMQNWWNYMDANYIGSANWAVETNTETSSVFTTTANANGPWQDSEITNSGSQVFQYIASKYDETMSQ